MPQVDAQAVERAELTRGISDARGYFRLAEALREAGVPRGGLLLDVGCGTGGLWEALSGHFDRCIGVDLVRYREYPAEREFVAHDLQTPGIPLPDGQADAAIACQVTPCVENPRLLIRELARLVKPGGIVVVTNPNPESFSSLLMLLVKRRYRAFQDATDSFMISPMLECDTARALRAAGLTDLRTFFSLVGKLPFSNATFPAGLARLAPRWVSDHYGIIARKPAGG
ncbi:MAG: methyltransferase domain-containing protein [Verrucomicrobia bacterium]|nr:methyltransferase domain-containing protein [Verrucomicrobiota bacterium]